MKTLFYIRRNKINSNNLCPLTCRVTFDSCRKEFSTRIFINPLYWSASRQKAIPQDTEHTQINTQLSLIKQELNQAFLLLQIQEKDFDVDDIFKQYKGENIKLDKTVIEMFNLHISKQEKLVGISITQGSISKFYQTKAHVKNFLKWKFNRSDFLLQDLKMSFINEFEYYLKAEKQFEQNTIHKTLQRFKQIIKQTVGLDVLDKDPFLLHKNKKPKKEIIFLTTEELANLEKHHFASNRLQQVADMFIFCCYTGLAYTEMASLKPKDLVVSFDKNIWINITRQKTTRTYAIPLLNKAKMILDKYKNDEQILPVISNQRFNAYLKEIADIVSIDKKLTHHIARKTFASTILLFNDVPMEIVSELLGHSEIGITQAHYAKVVQKKVSEQMGKLDIKLK